MVQSGDGKWGHNEELVISNEETVTFLAEGIVFLWYYM